METIQTRDDGDFAAFVQEMTPGLFRFAYGMVGNNADAEDAVQETWLDVYHSLYRLHDPDRIRIFVYRIASRRCTDILRDRYRRRDPVIPTPSQAIRSPSKCVRLCRPCPPWIGH